jgi:hypothetical protein
MRSSTINTNVTEEYYQKMEFYFSEIIEAFANKFLNFSNETLIIVCLG